MVVRRGEIWWATLPSPVGSGPGHRRPVLVVQSNDFNASRIRTVVVVALTSNVRLASAPGNVDLPRRVSGLSKPSVANVSQLLSIDRRLLTERVRKVSDQHLARVDDGLRLVLGLPNG